MGEQIQKRATKLEIRETVRDIREKSANFAKCCKKLNFPALRKFNIRTSLLCNFKILST